MSAIPPFRLAAGLVLVALLLSPGQAAAQEPAGARGRPLVEALRALQAAGLRIVFTTALVAPSLRVPAEPRARHPRQRLDELLAPHGLEVQEGPGGILTVVRATKPVAVVGAIEGTISDAVTGAALAGATLAIRDSGIETRSDRAGRFLLRRVPVGERVVHASAPGYTAAEHTLDVSQAAPAVLAIGLAPALGRHREYVTVTRPAAPDKDPGVSSGTTLRGSELDRLHGSLADDPIQLVHTFPRVSAMDEFRSDFTVRGAAFRHIDFVVDGVSARWLQHTAHNRGATGSLAMLQGQVLDEVTLRAGAYPRRYADRLGPQLDMTIREGSRARFGLRGGIGGTNATVRGEGPIGHEGRGSWLAAARQSYREWPPQSDSGRTAFGFFDGLAKVVYDIRPGQQAALTMLGGTSNIDGEDNLAPNELGDGTNRAFLVNFSWRSAFGSSFVVTQRAYVVNHRFENRQQTGQAADRGASREVVYRADLTRQVGGGLLEAGAEVGRESVDDLSAGGVVSRLAGSSWRRAVYGHFAWTAAPGVRLSSGVRAAASTLTPGAGATGWLLGEWRFGAGWTLGGSSGISQQLPELRHALHAANPVRLRRERAAHFDMSIGQQLTDATRWQATLYRRQDEDVLREPERHARLGTDGIALPDRRYVNALTGTSQGVELLFEHRQPRGLSGWAAYSYGRARHTDVDRGDTFWSDHDQRHAVTLFGVYRLSRRVTLGATFRAGSNFPVPGYLTEHRGQLFVGTRRNEVRLPPYARLDVRGEREFRYFGRRITLFVEMLNILNRANAGLTPGLIDPSSGAASGFTDTLFRRRASAGLAIDF